MKLMRKYRVHIPNHTCWTARKMMKEIVDGKHEEGYKYLAHYIEELKDKNPGSITFITWTDQGLLRTDCSRTCLPILVLQLQHSSNFVGL